MNEKVLLYKIFSSCHFKIIFIYPFVVLILIVTSCKDNNPVDDSGIRINPPIPPAIYNSPIWYPSGEFIGFNHTPLKSIHYATIFSSYPDMYELDYDSTGFWVINTDGTNMRRILPYTLQDPAWSPDGQWIAFVANAQIYKMKFTGTTFDTLSIVQLTTEGRNFFPAWSPDGKWIAFDSNNDSPNGMNFIWKMKADGSSKIRVAYDPSIGEIRMPDWSPNGNAIVHQRYIGISSPEIFTMDTSGSNAIRLTHDENFDSNPKYSPNGLTIAFTSQSNGGQPQIWLMSADGKNSHQLTVSGVESDAGVSFSWDPSGQFLVYSKYRFDQWKPQNGTLWVLDVNTGNERQLTFNLLDH